MFTEDLFELFSEYESLPEAQKPAFLAELKAQYPDKAEQLKLLTQDNHNFTEHFLENISSYSENMAVPSINEGDSFGVYTIVKPIGSGGMGQVYLAKRNDGLIEQQVAIKFLHPALYQLSSTQTLLNEAQALASLNHPNIATILDVIKMPDGLIYMVMEYIEGFTLTEYLAKNDLSIKDKLTLFLTIADAVQEAHSQRIIHADIKASNILINHKNQPQLIDFGIMQFVGSKEEKANTFINQYLCAMTVNYAAPEQLQGQPASIQSDVYALGGLLYFILSGQTPFEEIGGTLSDKIKVITEQEIPACKISQKLKFKQDIDWILSTCLAKQPEQRFRSVGALISELSNYLNNQPLQQHSNTFYRLSKSWQRHKITYALCTTLFLVVCIFASKIWYDNIQIQRSYNELSNSYLKQYTTMKESQNKRDEVKLPPAESLPISQYIKLVFQKHEQETIIYSDSAIPLKTILSLKAYLNQKQYYDDKVMALVNIREQISKFIFNGADTAQLVRGFDSVMERDDLTAEEIINLLFISHGESALYLVKNKYHQAMQRVDNLLKNNEVPLLSQIKFNVIKGHFYTSHISDNHKDPLVFSKEALFFCEQNPSLIPSYIYLSVLEIYGSSIEAAVGYTLTNLNFLKKVESYISQQHLNPNDNSIQTLLMKIEKVEQFHNFNPPTVINKEGSLFLGVLDGIIMESRGYSIVGDYEMGKLTLQKRISQLSEKYNQYIGEMRVNETFLMELYLKSGAIDPAISLINHKLLPHYEKNYSDDWKASYLSKFCIPLSYHSNVEELEPYCKSPYFLIKPILGETNFWTDYSLNQLVWWYALHPYNEEENKYVERLESLVPESLNYFKIQQLESLIFYFINRNNTEKASHYTEILEQTITDYAGDIYVVHRDTATLYKAEIALLNQDNKKAEELLSSAANKVCTYQPKNYLRMHLNQVSNKAGLGDMCLN